VSVKVEPNGAGGLPQRHSDSDVLDVSEPGAARPAIGGCAGGAPEPGSARPGLAMCTSSRRRSRERSGGCTAQPIASPFLRRGVASASRTLARGRVNPYSRPDAEDREGQITTRAGTWSWKVLDELRVPREGDFYLCGPSSFPQQLTAGLTAWGVPSTVSIPRSSPVPSLMPGVVAAPVRPPHPPADSRNRPLVSFARSGIAVRCAVGGPEPSRAGGSV